MDPPCQSAGSTLLVTIASATPESLRINPAVSKRHRRKYSSGFSKRSVHFLAVFLDSR